MSTELNLSDDLIEVRGVCGICKRPMLIQVARDPEIRAISERLENCAAHTDCIQDRQNKAAALRERATRATLFTSWQRICPDDFKKAIDFKICGARFKPQYEQVLSWCFGKRGMLAFGKTGRCKTRFIFKLLEREHFAGRSVVFVRHPEFREKVSRLSLESPRELYLYLKMIRTADILLFDDLGKARITEATEEALESLIDERTRNARPILFTTNEGDESLAARLSQDRGKPMLRRIFDFCEPIDFGFE